MATTKSRTPKSRTSTKAKADPGLVARTGRTVKQKPYVSAAIATGAVTVVAAAAAGAYLFSRKDKSFGEFASRVKDGFAEASDKVRDRFAKTKPQSEIAEEALTLKETGKRNDKPVDDQLTATVAVH
jgi:hypothetical protein